MLITTHTAERVKLTFRTPWGEMPVSLTEAGVAGLGLPAAALMKHEATPSVVQQAVAWRDEPRDDLPDWARSLAGRLARQLDAYFARRRRAFDLPLDLDGTDFQLEVWAQLRAIPYGATVGYGQIARRVGSPGAARAVGGACGANPAPILVPCHRVLAAGGRLGGFSGGLEWKRALLAIEREPVAA